MGRGLVYDIQLTLVRVLVAMLHLKGGSTQSVDLLGYVFIPLEFVVVLDVE